MTQQLIDGFEVQWSVFRLEDGKFQVEFTTRAPAADNRQTWPVPGGRFFATRDEAERYGKYILLGLRGVDKRGQPLFTVV